LIAKPNPDKPTLLLSGVGRTGRNKEIFATQAQRHEGFYFLFFFSVLVPWWREEKSFATKSTLVKLTLYFTGQAKFTTQELRARAKITSHFYISASAHLWLIPHSHPIL
jgi:hypothetical protein